MITGFRFHHDDTMYVCPERDEDFTETFIYGSVWSSPQLSSQLSIVCLSERQSLKYFFVWVSSYILNNVGNCPVLYLNFPVITSNLPCSLSFSFAHSCLQTRYQSVFQWSGCHPRFGDLQATLPLLDRNTMHSETETEMGKGRMEAFDSRGIPNRISLFKHVIGHLHLHQGLEYILLWHLWWNLWLSLGRPMTKELTRDNRRRYCQ